jgi:hypothetical protein
MATRIQHRATCSACGGFQAVNKFGAIAAHGYRVLWNQFEGPCAGSNRKHFGTPAGRDYKATIAVDIRAGGERLLKLATETSDADMKVFSTATFSRPGKLIENPTAWQIKGYRQGQKYTAEQMITHAQNLEAAVANWKAEDPVAVEVEKASGPAVHFQIASYWGRVEGKTMKACAGSAQAATDYALKTEDKAKVTCKRCLKSDAFKDA